MQRFTTENNTYIGNLEGMHLQDQVLISPAESWTQ